MQVGDLVKLRKPETFPGQADGVGLMLEIEEPSNKGDSDEAGASTVCTILWPTGKSCSSTGKNPSRHNDIDIDVINDEG